MDLFFFLALLYMPVLVCRSHELMSINMIDYIVDTHHIDVNAQMLKRVKVIFFLKTV